jgi:nitroreductase
MGPEKIDQYLTLRAELNDTKPEDAKGHGDMMKSRIALMNEQQLTQWTAKQAYITLGTLIAAASELQIDSCPMEGFDKSKFDELLGLKEKGLTSAVLAAVGYRSDEDKTQFYKKTRKPLNEIFETV